MNDVPQPEWAQIHSESESWRTRLIGEISNAYVSPRYLELFEFYFSKSLSPITFLELGSGNGEMAQLIAHKKFPFVGEYWVSEQFPEGVDWLKQRGLKAVQVNAQAIDFPAGAFDVVVSFDVMHHVENPATMAREMMRVGKGKLFLTESNGWSVGRKLMELTPGHRRAGEKSYTHFRYRSFFEHPEFQVTHFNIQPFIFPLKLPKRFMPAVIRFNQWIEKVPFLKWQCSNVYIYVEYLKK